MTPEENTNSSADQTPDVALKSLTREDLYALVWSEPMLKIAARYGVSSSYMARVCTAMNVPRPPRGYWAMLAVGKAPKQPALPEAKPWDQMVWSRDGDRLEVKRPLPRPPESSPKSRSRPLGINSDQHPLINGAKALFEVSRQSFMDTHLKPTKRLLVDLVVSKHGLDKALSFANQLFLALEAKGHRVTLTPNGEFFQRAAVDEHEIPRKNRNRDYSYLWSPARCTVVYMGTVAIGLTIIEMTEEAECRKVGDEWVRLSDYVPPKRGRHALDHSWVTRRDIPSGRLCLQAYSPYSSAEWVQQWRETKGHDLTSRIPAIVRTLKQSVAEVARLVEEGERKAEVERRQREAQYAEWQREEAVRRAAKAIKDSKDELLQVIEHWAWAKRLEQFFDDAEQRLVGMDAEEHLKMLERLSRARELVGSVDAIERLRHWKMPEER